MEIIERVDWRNWGFALYLYSQANEMRADAMPALLYMYAFFVAVLRAKDQESLEATHHYKNKKSKNHPSKSSSMAAHAQHPLPAQIILISSTALSLRPLKSGLWHQHTKVFCLQLRGDAAAVEEYKDYYSYPGESRAIRIVHGTKTHPAPILHTRVQLCGPDSKAVLKAIPDGGLSIDTFDAGRKPSEVMPAEQDRTQ
ncbi:MAG: hypothetical protein L6R37_006638 [Teloschistes peruensis]|nr:MAG: hypothetical protein L6R37_006638 [Teloschistes peruensis]